MKNLIALSFILPLSINAMDAKHELVQSGAIIAGGAVTAYVFGQGAEWVSNALAPHSTLSYNNFWNIQSQRQKVRFNKWGYLGTLWAGVPLALVSRIGSHPIAAQDLIRPMMVTYGATAGVAALAGAYTYMSKPDRENAVENAMIATRFSSFIAAPVGLLGYVIYKRIKG
jgi:hypothetical protein